MVIKIFLKLLMTPLIFFDDFQVIVHCTVRTVDGVIVESSRAENGGKYNSYIVCLVIHLKGVISSMYSSIRHPNGMGVIH